MIGPEVEVVEVTVVPSATYHAGGALEVLCWCDGDRLCVECGSQGPCEHGAPGARAEVVDHRRPA